MTYIAPAPLPKLAPISQVADTGKLPFETGVLMGMFPQRSAEDGGRPQFTYVARTLGGFEAPEMKTTVGSAWAGGVSAKDPEVTPTLDAAAFTASVSAVADGVKNLGREIPASTFDSARGVAELYASLGRDDLLVQTWTNSGLTTRVISDDAELDSINDLLEHSFGSTDIE